jgi:hypothetical protein
MPKEKVYVPVVEPKSTSCVEYVELGRTVTPQPVFRKDTIRVRVLQRCLGNPSETFNTEKHWEYDVPWPVEEVKVEEVVVEKQPVKEKKNLLQRIANA